MGHPSVALMQKARLLMKEVALMTMLTTQHAEEKARTLELDRSCCIARSLSACNASGAGQCGVDADPGGTLQLRVGEARTKGTSAAARGQRTRWNHEGSLHHNQGFRWKCRLSTTPQPFQGLRVFGTLGVEGY